MTAPLRGSHGLRDLKSSRAEGPKAEPKGRQLKVGPEGPEISVNGEWFEKYLLTQGRLFHFVKVSGSMEGSSVGLRKYFPKDENISKVGLLSASLHR